MGPWAHVIRQMIIEAASGHPRLHHGASHDRFRDGELLRMLAKDLLEDRAQKACIAAKQGRLGGDCLHAPGPKQGARNILETSHVLSDEGVIQVQTFSKSLSSSRFVLAMSGNASSSRGENPTSLR